MDGELNPLLSPDAETADGLAREPTSDRRPMARRPKTVLWLVIVGLLLVAVLGGFYGFNLWREHKIASIFAIKPPPAQIAAVKATSEAVPHFATGIGSLAAVHQVTITPEIGGRVTTITFEPGAVVK